MAEKLVIKGKSGASTTMWRYSNLILPLRVTDPEKRLREIEEFEYIDGDIIICSYPKTGSHWVTNLVHMLITGNTEPYGADPPFMDFRPNLDDFRNLPSPRFLITHLPFRCLPTQHKARNGKIIKLFRNPKDTAVSLYHFVKKETSTMFDCSWEDWFECFLTGRSFYGDAIDSILEWESVLQDNADYEILPLFYEDLKKDCARELRRICDYLNLDRSDEILNRISQACEINTLRQTIEDKQANRLVVGKFPPNKVSMFFRKGEVGDWKTHFTVAQNELYDKLLETKTKDSTIKFQYV